MIFSPPMLLGTSALPADATYVSRTATASNLNTTSHTFSGQDCGATSLGDYVVVASYISPNAAGTANATCTVNGVAATRIAGVVVNLSGTAEMFIVAAPTSGAQDVVINPGRAIWWCGVVVWRVKNLLSTTPQATLTSTAGTPTGTINIPANGVCLAIVGWGGNFTCTWAGLTEAVDIANGSSDGRLTAAMLEPTTTQTGLTVTATPSNAAASGEAMCVVALR